jgi:hypothetical protein
MSLTTEKTDLDELLLNSNISTNIGRGFELSSEITRPNDTIPYSPNDMILSNGLTGMQFFDFSILPLTGAKIGSIININEVMYVATDNGSVGSYVLELYLFETNILGSMTFLDNQSFNPSYADVNGKYEKGVTVVLGELNSSTPNLWVARSGSDSTLLNLNLQLGNSQRIYFVLCCASGNTPKANTKFKITIKGTIK